jgi:CheY-like chemotaxis protein
VSRILLCDDSRDLTDSTATLLRASGYEVVTADSGADALCRLAELPHPDLILLDWRMPGGGGAAVLAGLGPSAPPVVVMTGVADDHFTPDPRKVRRVLRKPAAPDELLAVVADVLKAEAYR